MKADIDIRPIDELSEAALAPLHAASMAEQYAFIDTLWNEYRSGVTRFDAPGILIGAYLYGALIGIGGVHQDPYLNASHIARVRHVYVMPTVRRLGGGQAIMTALIEHARRHFEVLTLRTPTAHGDAFYRAIGFSAAPRYEHATHWLALR